jgi:type II secretory pathway pseudopilin PulG
MAATATLASKAVTVTPGGEASLEVRVRNSGTVVDQFTLEVLGDASAWAIVEPAVIPLFPGAEAVARVKFKPPKTSSVPARAIPFAVRVRSREDSRASLVEEGVVEVGPFNDTFAELIPRTAKGSTRARAQLALDNRGNVRINARLTAADPDRKLNFVITPPALTAEPGTAGFASIRLSPRQRFLTGPPKVNPYKVHVHQDGLPTITVDGTMQQEGLIPKWLLPALIALLALLIILTILWFVLLKPAISSVATQAIAPQASAAQSAAARASTAASSAAQKAPGGGGGATGANPVGGDPWAARLAINPSSKPLESSITVPQGGGLAVTDLVFENPNGNSGTVYLVRRQSGKDDQILMTIRLENFRDLDFHFVTPLVFKENQTMTFSCSPDPTTSKCDAAVYYSGYFKNPPSS